MGNNHSHMVGYTLDMMEEPHVGIEHEENFDLQVLKKRNNNKDYGQALVLKDEEEKLAMGEIDNGMTFKSSRKGTHLPMDWVDEYITELEVQGCTILACMGRIFMDMSSNVKPCEHKNVLIRNPCDPSNMHSSTWESYLIWLDGQANMGSVSKHVPFSR